MIKCISLTALVRSMTGQLFMQREKVPIVVGGTGFYLRWYVHGRPQTPASTGDSMQRVQQRLTEVCLLSSICAPAWGEGHNKGNVTGTKHHSTQSTRALEHHASAGASARTVNAAADEHAKAADAAQAWEVEAAATQQSSLAPGLQWEVGRQLVASLGDLDSAER